MDLDYSEKGKVKVSMIKYVRKIVGYFLEEIQSTSSSLAADHLFQVRAAEIAKYFPEE